MALLDQGHSLFEPSNVKFAKYLINKGDMVDRGAGVELLKQPDKLLIRKKGKPVL